MSQSRSLMKAMLVGALLSTSALTGCATAYYGAMEQLGLEKRDLLIDRVVDAAAAQEDAKEEFANALEAFRAVVAVDGGELEATYDRLSKAHERSEERAERVRSRIKEVKGVSKDLFREWEQELDQYSDPSLRRASEGQLDATRDRYAVLAAKMDKAAASMDPVLTAFNDRVLFLKHNLNARAIASLGDESAVIENDVADLIAEMERSIAEADAFISEMRAGTV